MTKAKVLLASANRSVLQQMQRYLCDFDLTVFAVEDGPSAVQLARQHRPHLIVMEMELPGKSGVECCWQLRSQEATRSVPIVLLTTGHAWDIAACMAAGCTEHLSKPLHRESFISLGHKLLDSIERRESRVLCRTLARCRTSSVSFYGAIEDISAHGLFIATTHHLAAGEALRLRFTLPWPDAEPLDVDAHVAWINRGRNRKRSLLPEGFGVVFNQPSWRVVEQIEGYVEFGELLLNPHQG